MAKPRSTPSTSLDGKLVGPGRLGETNDSELASDTVSGSHPRPPEGGAEFRDDPVGGRRAGRRGGESRRDG